MRGSALRVVVAASAGLLCSCGGGGRVPSGPTGAAPGSGLAAGTVLTFVSGETGAPVATASVTAGGQVATSDAAGQVRLPSAAALGTSIEIRHPSVLDRISM